MPSYIITISLKEEMNNLEVQKRWKGSSNITEKAHSSKETGDLEAGCSFLLFMTIRILYAIICGTTETETK